VLDGFVLNNDLVLDKHVDAIASIYLKALIRDRQCDFLEHIDSASSEFNGENLLIG
jgi:hypothetical protein